MNKLTSCLVGLGFACMSTSCASYTGVAKADGQLYISGMTNYFIFSTPWIRRCDVSGTQLTCEELTEDKPRPRRGEEGGSSGKAEGETKEAAPAGEPPPKSNP